VVEELKLRAHKLATAEAGNGFEDLKAFGDAVGDARIVALGEATHGTREFFQMKHRLLEYLVREKGFTVLAREQNWPDALALDRYIEKSMTIIRTCFCPAPTRPPALRKLCWRSSTLTARSGVSHPPRTHGELRGTPRRW
jgi:hypothetical protein